MSGLVGLWNLDGERADRDVAAALASTLSHRGPDDAGVWVEGAFALAARLSRVTPESADECQPVVDAESRALVFDGRLDNRDDLVAALDGVSAGAPDAEIVLAAWRAWGRASLPKLAGDFALLCVDARRQELVLARDGIGCRPLYYWTDGRRFVCASEIKAILAHPHVPARPNDDLLADVLLPRLPHEDRGETFFHGIHAVLPGCLVRVTPDQTTIERFWDFDPHARVRYRSFDEYAEHLRTLLFEAVRRRLRSASPVGIAVSGGLDSSVVLSVADAIGRGAGTAAAVPFWCTDSDDPAIDEARFVRQLEQERALRVTRLPMGPARDTDDLLRAAYHSESPVADDGWCALRPMLAEAGTRGRRLVTGLWSDQLLFGSAYLTDLFFDRRWRLIARHLREYPRWFVDADPAYFRWGFARALVAALAPPYLRRRRPKDDRAYGATAHARSVYHVVRAKSFRLQIESDEKIAAAYGLEHASPFLDRDVIAFVMAIPGEVLTRDGVPRALLRASMRGVVPDSILARRWRGEHAARVVDHDALAQLGLELWRRQFFSDRLGAPQQKGSRHGDTETGGRSRREAAILAADAHGAR